MSYPPKECFLTTLTGLDTPYEPLVRSKCKFDPLLKERTPSYLAEQGYSTSEPVLQK